MTHSSKHPTDEQIRLADEQIIEQSKRIGFYITEYSVEILAKKVHDNEYIIPSYQREFTWENKRKSRFIESLIMGLPIPFFFFWEMSDGKLEIVDGSQRLRTIEEFIYKGFKLDELDSLTHLTGFRFEDLPESRQRKIKNRSVRGIVMNENADEAARLDMFERINTGSKNANMAEIRRGALSGPFLDLVVELSNFPLLHTLAPISAKVKKERGYEELITRFFAYSDGLESYRDRPSDFLFDYSKKMNNVFNNDSSLAETYRQRFVDVLDFVSKHFPFGFKRSIKGNATPRTRFEAISLGVYNALKENPSLNNLTPEKTNVNSWISGDEFKSIVRADGANAKSRLQGRINFVKNKLVNNGNN
ncbi:DUF262 domain-containing protein [Rothia sp. HMSC065G12]|jgi:hypothetical protein|uniref:DUF262 domain-containing protein n=1 Tax=Rothia sp. HMSC065G12 TaxID=1739308 RepID=UPI0008A3510E|nr:DUF262 domain-containing protein [Rothia sp. HMSC065G12]OFK71552.1 hypothetical protein HMPREF2804_00590 [Rothia sp. HMSC065G12]